ncbi:MAG: hypothetical protein HC837_20085 [Chloroflexaceae bacterium]|nr:hypothetical protein [Chloroflexaceae bacterium]
MPSIPPAVAAAETMLAHAAERHEQDWDEAIQQAQQLAREIEAQTNPGHSAADPGGTAYNTRYQFAAQAADPDEQRYAEEEQRLTATELPHFREQIQQAQREAEEELREHVLHRLREQILVARQQLERINDALARLEFHGERYRFISQPAEERRAFYELIDGTHRIGPGSLFQSEFYAEHKEDFDQLYAALTHTPQSEREQRELEHLTDYRRYLSYDIQVTHGDGRTSNLSKIIGQTSGGETQTPFYLTIAASFVQLYHIHDRNGRPTIRLVAFDEAFSKMDQDRIGATLDLFQQFGLQIITATPLERCEYLVPKICTTLVLTAVSDTVLIEPYRNYDARLELIEHQC